MVALGMLFICALGLATLRVIAPQLLFPFGGGWLASVFFPRTALPPFVSDSAVGAERVDFRSHDGVPQAAWRLATPGVHPWMLYFHGNATAVTEGLDRYRLFQQLGFNIFAPEYRGYNGVPGHPGEASLAHDALAAYQYLRETEHLGDHDIVIYGWSLGSAVAIDLATRVTPRALIAEGSPASIAAIVHERFPVIPISLVLPTNRFESIHKLTQVRAPVLFIHARDDEVVPFANGRRLYDVARDPKAFLELDAGGHADGPIADSARYLAGARQFLDSTH
jgi:fermentation-respiration switch protein FrsA (DUF1100 family)